MERTIHNKNFSKANDRNNTNAVNKFTTLNLKGQYIHAYLHPANTDRSYSIETEEKLKYL